MSVRSESMGRAGAHLPAHLLARRPDRRDTAAVLQRRQSGGPAKQRPARLGGVGSLLFLLALALFGATACAAADRYVDQLDAAARVAEVALAIDGALQEFERGDIDRAQLVQRIREQLPKLRSDAR